HHHAVAAEDDLHVRLAGVVDVRLAFFEPGAHPLLKLNGLGFAPISDQTQASWLELRYAELPPRTLDPCSWSTPRQSARDGQARWSRRTPDGRAMTASGTAPTGRATGAATRHRAHTPAARP